MAGFPPRPGFFSLETVFPAKPYFLHTVLIKLNPYNSPVLLAVIASRNIIINLNQNFPSSEVFWEMFISHIEDKVC